MADIILKDRAGNDATYEGVTAVRLPTADGGTQDFVAATIQEKMLYPDFSAGGFEILPDVGNLLSKVTVLQPPELRPENIAEGVTVAGIEGTHAGSTGERNAIKFYDAYGNVVYSYTRSEIKALTELPPGPELGDLTFECWTHTLEELQSVLYFADVGPCYKKGDYPAVVAIIYLTEDDLSVTLRFTNVTAIAKNTLYWGDGSSAAMSTTMTHTYTTPGYKIISMACISGRFGLGYYASNNNYSFVDGASISGVATNTTKIMGVNYKLISVLIGTYDTMAGWGYYNLIETVCGSQSLRFVSLYGIYNTLNRTFLQCPNLRAIAGKKTYSALKYAYYGCVSLRRLPVSSGLTDGNDAFVRCISLGEVIYDTTATGTEPNMNVDWAMLMTKTTPPTIGASSPVWGTKPIYVPDEAVDTYKATDGWSNAAAYIFPASQYPDT